MNYDKGWTPQSRRMHRLGSIVGGLFVRVSATTKRLDRIEKEMKETRESLRRTKMELEEVNERLSDTEETLIRYHDSNRRHTHGEASA